MYLGVGVGNHSIHVTSSLGQRSSITSDRVRAPQDWVELATYGISLPEDHRLLACVAVPSGGSREESNEIVSAARQANWDGVLLVSAVHAAARAIKERTVEEATLTIVVVDSGVSSVGILSSHPLAVVDDDPVHPVAGREAREVAVSLRCLLKQRPKAELRELLRRVLVTGDQEEVERIGRRLFERELEALGIQTVEFETDPFLVARGAELIAAETATQAWHRIRRAR